MAFLGKCHHLAACIESVGGVIGEATGSACHLESEGAIALSDYLVEDTAFFVVDEAAVTVVEATVVVFACYRIVVVYNVFVHEGEGNYWFM